MSDKIRLDIALTQRGLAESREKAKALIMAGQVYLNDRKELKAGASVKPDDEIEVRGNRNPFVSRGGLKVYSIDVGYGQLAWKLRTDERVVNMERTNFRYVTHNEIPEDIDFASVDVSFISLRIILPVLRELLKSDGQAVCLIKPQFEAGREKIGKKGVVRDPQVHVEVVENIVNFALENGFDVKNLDFSPIKGPEGNIEYLMHIQKSENAQKMCEITPEELVKLSHGELDK